MDISMLEQQIKKLKRALSGTGPGEKERALRKRLKRAQRRRRALIVRNAAVAKKAKGRLSESTDARTGG